MLYISIDKQQENELTAPDVWVRLHNREVLHHLKDDIVRSMILDVDKTEVFVDSEGCAYLNSPYIYKYMPIDYLSTGVKNLIMAWITVYPINATHCGDNCAKWLVEISKRKDLYITLHHIMTFPKDTKAVILNNNKQCESNEDIFWELCEVL
jgi:hypothetical protein